MFYIRSKGNHYMNGMYCNSYPLCIDCVKKSKSEEVDCDECGYNDNCRKIKIDCYMDGMYCNCYANDISNFICDPCVEKYFSMMNENRE